MVNTSKHKGVRYNLIEISITKEEILNREYSSKKVHVFKIDELKQQTLSGQKKGRNN